MTVPHSMPSMPAGLSAGEKRINTDIVVGDRFGTSSDVSFVEALEQAIRKAGYLVQRNKPYAGGYITEHYGKPIEAVHAIQIEVNRSLYMDEHALQRAKGFDTLKQDLTVMLAQLACAALDFATLRKAAAE